MNQNPNIGGSKRTPSPRIRNANTSRVSSVMITRNPLFDASQADEFMSNVFGPLPQIALPRPSPGRPEARETNYRDFEMSMAQAAGGNFQCPCSHNPHNQFLLDSSDIEDEPDNPEVAEERRQSIMEWFDKSVSGEMEKRRDLFKETSCLVQRVLKVPDPNMAMGVSAATLDRLAESTATGRLEVPVQLLTAPDTELTEAVNKLAKAEEQCAFEAAVHAAEQAARAAPPELAEEAAAQGAARGFITVETTNVRQVIPGERPIEVIGYVGITSPKDPKRS